MNIKQLEAFLLVAQLKNFTKAAAQLDMSQPAVSFQIKSLEEELNITLFERNDKKVVLTEAGRLLFPIAMQMVRQYNKIKAGIDDLREVKAGHLMLGAVPVAGEYLLPLVIGGFREQYPAVTVSLQIGGSARVSQWLKDRDVEMGIAGCPVKAEGIECEPWVTDHMVVVTPPWHPLSGEEVPLAALTNESIIVREVGSGSRQALEQQLLKHNITLDQFSSVLELGSTQAVINAVRLGLGIGAVSRWAAGELLEKGCLGEVRVPGVNLSYDLYLAWNRPDKESLASRAFRSFISDEEITRRFFSNILFYRNAP
ncbi:LysR family transcriptional regulator [Desulfallas sp. Bu1-1]|uniref:selenium metabolism-associated LysR family transcriptional regulator n=1 Tax=Desulfallas sp. Bu1-1 TaxID=2787620 RepID=UPI0018A10213|nr:selenium metabolism-associated LysR family transcriptional regulator [Desulfallas sp. Bu1-1]MBF7082985.1 LysR family transcriptional regulator [Desulfallas sp. Bu1-1]